MTKEYTPTDDDIINLIAAGMWQMRCAEGDGRIPKRKRASPFDWRCQNCGMTKRACLSVSTPCCQLCSHAPEDEE